MTALSMLVKNIVEVNYDTLPVDTVGATKRQILDTLGVAVAGSISENIRQIVELVKDWGGKEESTILGYGGKVPCPNAALANGMLSAVLDYDDIHEADRIHVSRAIVAASLAVAEYRGATTGKDLIVGVALGTDLACRLARAVVPGLRLGWDSDIANFFGAAATASKLLGLDEEKVINAQGIAYLELSAAGESAAEGPSIKGLSGGLAAEAGVRAALLASKGLNTAPEFLEGSRRMHGGGYYNTIHRGFYTPQLLTIGLGTVFEGSTMSIKPYPSCRGMHAATDATLVLVREHDIRPEDVVKVTAKVGEVSYALCQPLEKGRGPRNAIASQFSLPWGVANAILYRKVGIDSFTEEALQDTKLIDMAHKVVCEVVAEFCTVHITGDIVEPAIIEIEMQRGEVYSKRVDVPYGNPKNPMSFDDLVDKFRECCTHAVKPISRENQDKVVTMVERLEDVTDVSQIVNLLV